MPAATLIANQQIPPCSRQFTNGSEFARSQKYQPYTDISSDHMDKLDLPSSYFEHSGKTVREATESVDSLGQQTEVHHKHVGDAGWILSSDALRNETLRIPRFDKTERDEAQFLSPIPFIGPMRSRSPDETDLGTTQRFWRRGEEGEGAWIERQLRRDAEDEKPRRLRALKNTQTLKTKC